MEWSYRKRYDCGCVYVHSIGYIATSVRVRIRVRFSDRVRVRVRVRIRVWLRLRMGGGVDSAIATLEKKACGGSV